MFENASVSGPELLAIPLFLAACLAPGAITALKGHQALFVVGYFFGPVWLLAAFRLAKPNSPWARRFYSPEKQGKAQTRYPKVDPSDPDRSKLVLTVGFGLLAAVLVAGFIAGATQG